MDFEYTPEQIQLRKAVREFAEGEIAPFVSRWDETRQRKLAIGEGTSEGTSEIQRLAIARQLLKN